MDGRFNLTELNQNLKNKKPAGNIIPADFFSQTIEVADYIGRK